MAKHGTTTIAGREYASTERINTGGWTNATPEQITAAKKHNEAIQSAGLSSDPEIARGQAIGRQRGEEAYGQTLAETGGGVQDIIRRRREALEGKGPGATQLRQARGQRLRMARARGAGAGQMAQIERESASDIAAQQYTRDQKALSAYQRLIGNILGGQTSLEMGFAGLEKGGQQVQMPQYGGGGGGILGGLLGKIICAELYHQGYMSEDIYQKDQEYGYALGISHPYTMLGYHILAIPVVELMKRNKLFTKLVSFPALAWARDMAGDKNLSGAIISLIGKFICDIVGRIYAKTVRGTESKA